MLYVDARIQSPQMCLVKYVPVSQVLAPTRNKSLAVCSHPVATSAGISSMPPIAPVQPTLITGQSTIVTLEDVPEQLYHWAVFLKQPAAPELPACMSEAAAGRWRAYWPDAVVQPELPHSLHGAYSVVCWFVLGETSRPVLPAHRVTWLGSPLCCWVVCTCLRTWPRA